MMTKLKFITPILALMLLITSCEECEFKAVLTTTFPEATVGSYYSTNIDLDLSCSEDFKEYIFVSGSLPPGLGMGSDGHISGTPSQAGTYNFTLRIKVCFSTDYNTGDYTDCHEKTEGFSITVN